MPHKIRERFVKGIGAAPDGMSLDTFLRDYWQKQPVLLKGVFAVDFAPLTPDELGGLSLEEDIDARIVICEPKKDKWEIEHGPFPEERFSTLKTKNWTLLVQGVDHWVPAVAELRRCYGFLPHWRFDDVMVSYAVEGGGVGPHIDQYDVFLIQGVGNRRWRVGTKDQPVENNDKVCALRQVKAFAAQMDVIVEPGDVLYVPPNTPHWGVALNNSMTYSVGFRAPASTDIFTQLTDNLINQNIDGERYSDPDWHANNDQALIPTSALNKVQNLLLQALAHPVDIERAFAQLVTQTRYPLAREGRRILKAAKIMERLQAGKTLERIDDARAAWFVSADHGVKIYANGKEIEGSFSSELASFLCSALTISRENADQFMNDLAFSQALTTLVNRGVFTF